MGTIFADGINQVELVDAIEEIVTDWNATMTKLDSDTGVNGTNFNTLWKMTLQTMSEAGIGQGDLVAQLQDMVTCINGANAKLDLDSGVANTNYAATWNVTDKINEATYPTDILTNGLRQGDLVRLLYTVKTNINGIQAKLDADATVNSTNYASANPISFEIDVTGC